MENTTVTTVETQDSTNDTSPTTTMATSSDTSSTSTTVANSETCSTSTVEPECTETTNTFLLKFSLVCRPFKLPEYADVALEAIRYFDDPEISVDRRKQGSEVIYRMEINEQRPKFGNALTFTVEGIKYNCDLIPHEPRTGSARARGSYSSYRDNNILLTFQQAGQRMFNHISMEIFDKMVQNELRLTLEKPTEKQKIRYTQVYNGNRYCVIRKPDNLADIPDFLPIVDPISKITHHIRITYAGKLYNCGRCLKQHSGQCPLLADFYAAKEERERMERDHEIKTKLISDSTLRNADQLGLCADVMTMSGGGLGQVVQAAIDDPDTKNKKHVMIMGGTNDIKNRAFENDIEFAQNISTTITKIYDLAISQPEKKFTLINSHPSKEESTDNTLEEIQRKTRELYLHAKLHETVKKMPELEAPITNVDIVDVKYDIDETGHPTVEGTIQILQTLNDFVKPDRFIWNNDFITTENKYRGVQSIYKYGCNHCTGYGQSIQNVHHRNSNVCDDCVEILRHNAQLGDFGLIERIRKEVTKKFRTASDSGEDSPRKNKIQCLSSNIVKNNQNEEQDVEMPPQE